MGDKEQPDHADLFSGRYQPDRSFDQEQFLGDARYAAVQAGDLDANQNSKKLQKLRNSTKDFDIHSSFQSSADPTAVDNLDGYGSDEGSTLAFNVRPALSTPGLHRPLIDFDPMAQFVTKDYREGSEAVTDAQAESVKRSKKEKKRQKKEKKKEKKKSSKKRKRGNSSSSE